MKPPILFGTFLLLLPAFAQTPNTSRPEFEVASIKPNTSGVISGTIEMPPNGRLTANNVPLRNLIGIAYDIRESQFAGAPEWLGSERYDVAAKAESNVSRDQMRLMLQSLFADRLKLTVHREMRQAQVYELTPAKGGLKLTPTTAGSCQTFDRDHPPPFTPGGPIPNICGNLSGPGRGQIAAWGVPMVRLAAVLSGVLGRAVLDKTGATGNYNFRLEFTPDQATAGGPFGAGGPGGDAALPDSASPNIFTALQEQLGIKVDSAKGSVEMLVIDHVERPSEN